MCHQYYTPLDTEFKYQIEPLYRNLYQNQSQKKSEFGPLLPQSFQAHWKEIGKDFKQYVKLLQEEKEHQDNSPSKRNETASMNQIYREDSALHSLGVLKTALPTISETAQHEREHAKSPTTLSRKISKVEVSCSFSLWHLVKKPERKMRQD